MTGESFGIGFDSCGFITQYSHIPSVEYLPGVHVAGIRNRTRETAEEQAERCREEGWGDPSVYGEDELVALIEDPDVDGLWVTGPNFLRVEVIEAAMDAVEDGADLAGIAIEKPLARNLAEAERIIDRIDAAGVPAAYLENWAHEPTLREARELLWERGRPSGRPYIARSRAEHGGPHSGWFWDGRRQGGGALTDMLCHALAGNEVLLSDPAGELPPLEATRVDANAETLKWGRPEYAEQLREEYGVDYEEHPADDYARATVTYETAEGTRLMSEASGSWCYVGAGVSRSIELLGPEYSGRVMTDESAESVFFSDAATEGEGWLEKQTASSGRMPVGGASSVNSGFVAENRDATDAFANGEDGMLDLGFGYGILELCMGAYKAAEEERTMTLGDPSLVEYVPPPARH